MKKTRKGSDPELREMVKLMAVESVRDEAQRLENERIDFERKQRALNTPAAPVAQGTGWVDATK